MATDPLARSRNRILRIDALSGLKQLPDNSVDCVMTSPPYWGLRDYGIQPLIWDGAPDCKHAWQPLGSRSRESRSVATKAAQGARVGTNQHSANFAAADYGETCHNCNAWRGSLGLEPTIELYLRHLLRIMDEVQRVLKPTGTCWINLGDSYAGHWGARRLAADRVPPKSLNLIPQRFVVAMTTRGWLARNHIAWYKPNHMPASVKDRLANAWDHLFLFTNSPRYYFDLDAIRVPHRSRTQHAPRTRSREQRRDVGPSGPTEFHPHGKNPGDCWAIPTQAAAFAHYATYPQRLVEYDNSPPAGWF